MNDDPGTAIARATSRRSFLGLLGLSGTAAAVPSLLSACSNTSRSSASSSTYRIVQPSKDPLVVFAVSYLAEDKGYYKDAGLSVKRVLLPGGPPSLQGLVSGSGDALISTPGETLSAVAKSQDLHVMMGHTNNMPSTFVISAAVAKKLGITAGSPLRDRRAALGRIADGRYGITAPGSQTDAFTRLALKQAGVPDSQARIVPLQTASNCLAALANGDIDGYIGVPPVGEEAVVQAQAVALLTAQTGEIAGADKLQGMSLVVRGPDLKKKAAMFEAAIGAEVRAMKDLNDDFAAAGLLLRKTRFGKLDEKVWNATWSRLAPSVVSPVVTKQSLDAWLSNGLIDAGKVTSGDVDLDAVIDMSIVESARKKYSWAS